MKQFPFPNRVNSMDDLARDAVYNRIPEGERELVCAIGWNHGVEVAHKIIEAHGKKPIDKILEAKGVKLVRLDKDKVAGGLRYFSEFFEKAKTINIYKKSVAKFAEANELFQGKAEELILAHEFYHYLECYEFGNSAQLYSVYYKLGPFKLFKSGVRALSEIAANAFARVYWENRYGEVPEEQTEAVHNWVLSDTRPYEGREYATNFMNVLFGKKLTKKLGYGDNPNGEVLLNKPLKK